MSRIKFHFVDINPALKNRKILKGFIEKIFLQKGQKIGSLTYIFCSDDYLLKINKDFLKHDFYTDVITFDLSNSNFEVEGEIYISVERVRDNAEKLGSTIKEELHRVIFHGALHLCGYKDKLKNDIIIMRKEEDECLKRYFATH